MHTCGANHIVTYISANGKTNWETNQKGNKSHANQYPCTENGAEEAESCGGMMLAMEDCGKLRAMHQ